MARKRPTKTEIFQKIAKLQKELEVVSYRIRQFREMEYRSGTFISEKSISFGLKHLEMDEKQYKDWRDKNWNYGSRDSVVQMFVNNKCLKDKSQTLHSWDVRSDIVRKLHLLREKYTLRQCAIMKDISALKSRWLTIKAENNKNNLGPSIRDKIISRSKENVNDFEYCTRTGRRIRISFLMSRKDPAPKNNWANTQQTTPNTFAEIAIAKLGGYMFDANFNKKQRGNTYVYGTGYRTDGTGLIQAANSGKASPEVMALAQKFMQKMKDSIYCTYIDTGKVSSFKISSIFTIDPTKVDKPIKKVNKLTVKLHKLWTKLGFGDFYEIKETPDPWNSAYKYQKILLKKHLPFGKTKLQYYARNFFPKSQDIWDNNNGRTAITPETIEKFKNELITNINTGFNNALK